MPIYQVTGVATLEVCRTYDASNAEAAKIGDGELIQNEILDEKDFVIESVEEIEQAVPILQIMTDEIESLKAQLAEAKRCDASVALTINAVVARAEMAEEALVRISEALRVYREAKKL